MARGDDLKFEQKLKVVDGRHIYTIAGSSADFEWKLTPGSSALIWTSSDYDHLENCSEIQFDDLIVSIDPAGQISTRARLTFGPSESALNAASPSKTLPSEPPTEKLQPPLADQADPASAEPMLGVASPTGLPSTSNKDDATSASEDPGHRQEDPDPYYEGAFFYDFDSDDPAAFDRQNADQAASAKLNEDGSTTIDLRYYLTGGFEGRSFAANSPRDGTQPDGLYVSKAWAKHGHVEIPENGFLVYRATNGPAGNNGENNNRDGSKPGPAMTK